jgi:hypothetical protein
MAANFIVQAGADLLRREKEKTTTLFTVENIFFQVTTIEEMPAKEPFRISEVRRALWDSYSKFQN